MGKGSIDKFAELMGLRWGIWDMICICFPAGREIMVSTGLLQLDGFEPHTMQKIKAILLDGFHYLVDDIGLEPMTFRTSSGCSSQLS